MVSCSIMTASADLLADIEDDLVRVTENRFFRAIAEGTLPRAVFRRFLEEDVKFLDYQVRYFRHLSTRVPPGPLGHLLEGLAGGLAGALPSVYAPLMQRFETSLESALAQSFEPATEVYIRTLGAYAVDAPVVEAIGAELAVLSHPEVVGERLRRVFTALPDTDYGNWIREWGANPAYRGALSALRAAFDGMAHDVSGLDGARRAHRTISRLETLYWETFDGEEAVLEQAFPRRLFDGMRDRPRR